jgi:hypothetical protein
MSRFRFSRRSVRAFTLVEAVISAALSAALMLVVLAWVGAVSDVASEAPARSGTLRSAQVLEASLLADFDRAGPCDALRSGSPVAAVGPDRLVLHADVDRDGQMDSVEWVVSGGLVTRTVRAGTDNCEFAQTGVTRVMADEAQMSPDAPFVPLINGAALTIDELVICAGVPDPCRYNAIVVDVVLEAASGGPVMVNRTVALR